MILSTGPNRFLVLAAYVVLVLVALLLVTSRAEPTARSLEKTGIGAQQTQYAGPEGY
ncbi:MAG: hypothetical protein JWQ74_3228 [Marmoricola sp.]|nr:hypothetical protein [Marmoricola sp.]